MEDKQLSVNILHQPRKPDGKSWRFFEIGIINVSPSQAEIKADTEPINILPTIQNLFDSELTKKGGMFSNILSIPHEDEDLDELLCVEVYGMKCSFQPFLTELKNNGVADLFGHDLIKVLFEVLRKIGIFMKENTERPQAIKNHIISMLEACGSTPLISAIMQISVMRGIELFLQECLDTLEGYGVSEAQDLLEWVVMEEGKLICMFTIMPLSMVAIGQELAEHIKPFTDYLYSTEIGKLANDTTLATLYGYDITDAESMQKEAAWNNNIDVPQEANAELKRSGRKVGDFRDNLMVDEKEKDVVIGKLRLLIAGRKGKDVALIIYSCVKLGWLIKPSFSQVKNTFGHGIGNKSGYNNYVNNPSKFTEQEISGMIERLKAL